MRKLNKAGIDLIKKFEGCALRSYRDIGAVLTIGYGHTGTDVTENMFITEEEANNCLNTDLDYFCFQVSELVKISINDNQFAALVSFAFNLGVSALRGSTLIKVVNEGRDPSGEFLKWVFVKGRIVGGLVKRRNAEVKLYHTPVINSSVFSS